MTNEQKSELRFIIKLERSIVYGKIDKMKAIMKCESEFSRHKKFIRNVARHYASPTEFDLPESNNHLIMVNDNKVTIFANGWPILKCSVNQLAKYGLLLMEVHQLHLQMKELN